MFGIGFGIGKYRNDGIGTGTQYTATVYVDQSSGSDANSGLTELLPKQTIAAIPLQNGMRIRLARGSVWHEEINLTGYSNILIDSYGTGALPVLDASDPCPTSWVVDGANNKVYNQTLTHTGDTGLYLSIWENGVRPKWVASKALCQATPGTFTVGLSTAGSDVFSIHPLGDTNPASDGKAYTYSARNYGVLLGSNCTMNDIRTRKQIHNNGSTVMGANCVANRCIFEDGVKHNVFASTGSVLNDCIAWKSDWIIRDNHTSFVAFAPTITTGEVTFNRCVSLMELAVLQDANSRGTDSTAFYAHTDGGLGHVWSNITYNQCTAKNNGTGFSVSDTVLVTSERCHAETAVSGFSFNGTTNNVTDPWVNETDSIKCNRPITSLADGALNIDGARVYTVIGGDGQFYDAGASGTTNLSNSVFYKDIDANYQYGVRMISNRTLNMNGCIISLDQTSTDNAGYAAPVTGTIDHNLYAGSINLDYEVNGSNYSSYALYRAGKPLLDVNSQALAIGVSTGLVDPANGDFHVTPGSPATTVGAGLLRPDAVYTAIPSHATVAAM